MEIFGYEFRNEVLLEEALTTPAHRTEDPSSSDNQRLEFLGDAVLGLLSAEYVYGRYPREPEGRLTFRHHHMVSATALCETAARLGLRARLRFNANAVEPPDEAKTFADAMEAVIGAAYLDGGLDAARRIFESWNLIVYAEDDEWCENPKGELQVRAQALKPPKHPNYKLISMSGKAHEPVFTVRVTLEGIGEATAEARTRKDAESASAARLLKLWKK